MTEATKTEDPQIPLPGVDMTPAPPGPRSRPKDSDAVVKDRQKKLVREQVRVYFTSEDPSYPDSEIDDAVDQLIKAMEYEIDTYRVARNLDRNGWDPNDETLQLIEDTLHSRYEAHRAAVEEWVIEQKIVPTLKLGDKVLVKERGLKTKLVEGEITDIHLERAEYTVMCPSLGHVRKGTIKRGSATLGSIVPYEEATLLPVVEAPAETPTEA